LSLSHIAPADSSGRPMISGGNIFSRGHRQAGFPSGDRLRQGLMWPSHAGAVSGGANPTRAVRVAWPASTASRPLRGAPLFASGSPRSAAWRRPNSSHADNSTPGILGCARTKTRSPLLADFPSRARACEVVPVLSNPAGATDDSDSATLLPLRRVCCPKLRCDRQKTLYF
jgi:hypothetical protein